MQDNLGQSQELFRTSLKKFQTQNDLQTPPPEPRREYFADSLSKEVLHLKRKMTELELNHNTMDAAVRRVTSENKQKWNNIQEQVNTEIQTFGLLKDRLQLEMDIIKKQMGIEGSKPFKQGQNLQPQVNFPSENGNAADIKYLMDEFAKMKQRVTNLESQKSKSILDKKSEKDLIVELYKPNENSRSNLGMSNIPKDREMTLAELTDFYHEQKRRNYNFETKLRNLPLSFNKKASVSSIKNPFKKDMPPDPEERGEVLLDKVMNIEKDIKRLSNDMKEQLGNLAIAEKDILNLREVQRLVVNDVDNLKASEKSKFRAVLPEGIGFTQHSGRDSGQGDFNNDLQMTKVKVQIESLFEKINVNNDKMFKVENQLMDINELLNRTDSRNNIQKTIDARFGEIDLEIQTMKENQARSAMNLEKKIKDLGLGAQKMSQVQPTQPIGSQSSLKTTNGLSPQMVKRIVRDETDHIFEFIQEYVNEIASDCIYTIKSEHKSATQKMNCLDWLARNIEFVSMKLFDRCVKLCIQLKDDPNQTARQILYQSPHNSTVLISLRRLIIETQDANVSEGIRKQLPQYLRLLEICLFNDTNVKKAFEDSFDQLMLNIITEQSSPIPVGSNMTSLQSSMKSVGRLRKISISEMSKNLAKSCLNLIVQGNVTAINTVAQRPYFIEWISRALDYGAKLDVTNTTAWYSTFQIMRSCFKSTAISELCLKENGGMVVDLIKATRDTITDEAVLTANLEVSVIFH